MAHTYRDPKQASRELTSPTVEVPRGSATLLSGSAAEGVQPTARNERSEAGGSTGPTRIPFVDALRGYAVLLMILDHLLVQVAPGHFLRWTVTRLALPLFGLCAGFVLTRASSATRRYAVLGVGLLLTPLGIVLGLGVPDVLLVFGLALIVAHASIGRVPPALLAAFGILGAVAWPLPITGYHPAYVLAFIACGMALRADLEQRQHMGTYLEVPAPAFLVAIGRHPLAYYAGHLVVIYLLSLLLGWVPAVGLGGELL